MKVEVELSGFEAKALAREARANAVSVADMILAYMRDGLRIKNAPTHSRRRQYREHALTFESLTDYDPHPNPRYNP